MDHLNPTTYQHCRISHGAEAITAERKHVIVYQKRSAIRRDAEKSRA